LGTLIIDRGSDPISRGTPKATSKETASSTTSVVKNADRDCQPFGAPLAPKCVATTAGRTAANFRARSTPSNTKDTKIEAGSLLLDPTVESSSRCKFAPAPPNPFFFTICRAFFRYAY
jgi:hypothetical protein